MTSELRYKQSKINWKQAGLFLLAILLFTAAMFYRRADAFTNPQFWAEDGMVFFMEQDHHDEFIPFQNYNGYIHLLPRIVAYSAKLLAIPYEWVPHFYNITTFLFYLFYFGLLWRLTKFTTTTKFLMLVSTSIIPIATEVYMNVTNLQWFSVFGLIVLLFDIQFRTRLDKIYLLIGIVLAGLTGPFSVMLAPLLLIKAWSIRKNVLHLIPYATALIVGSIQLIFLYNHYQGRLFPTMVIPENHLGVMLYNIIKQTLFFDHRLIAEFRYRHLIVIIPAVLSYLLAIVWSVRKKKNDIALLLGCIFINLFFTIKVNWPYEWLMSPFLGGMRYFFIPFTLTIWIMLINFNKKPILQSLIMALLLINFLMHGIWVRSNFIDFKWKDEVKEYYEKGEVIAPINPPGWFVVFKQKHK